ncbi:MAG: PaaI family thioesterase, partial [Syntrophomonadaceae bacterium]
ELDEDAGYVTIDINSSMLGASNSGRLIIEGRSIKIGKSVCMSEATMINEAGRLIAHGESKMLVTHGMQTMASAVEAMCKEPLPKKFI